MFFIIQYKTIYINITIQKQMILNKKSILLYYLYPNLIIEK